MRHFLDITKMIFSSLIQQFKGLFISLSIVNALASWAGLSLAIILCFSFQLPFYFTNLTNSVRGLVLVLLSTNIKLLDLTPGPLFEAIYAIWESSLSICIGLPFLFRMFPSSISKKSKTSISGLDSMGKQF